MTMIIITTAVVIANVTDWSGGSSAILNFGSDDEKIEFGSRIPAVCLCE